MDAEQNAKIESGVLACLDECRVDDRPFTRLSAFLAKLATSGWTEAEVIELQTRVIRVLLYRHKHDGDGVGE